ncbi:hypothetical protein OPV22_009906 [Ensete ventricosum]|uniref:Uncharacterized protein n=1 Tax=Ensete ventricosum TaxID=4639 RepID=A0AAV8RBX3_ENSVE|nr:hypothetical protein OPV22_009906 [Ensete ventricosum]
MSDSISESVALVRSQLEKRRLDGRTIQILESVLVSRDVQSLLETRSALRQLFRSEALSVMGGISSMTVDRKLSTVQFFVWAFALVGDVESCLALKYEALVLRESKHLKIHGLEVSFEEWLTFAKDSLDNGFYPIAIQGFERALHCFQTEKIEDPEFVMSSEDAHIIKYMKNLKDVATSVTASCSADQIAELCKLMLWSSQFPVDVSDLRLNRLMIQEQAYQNKEPKKKATSLVAGIDEEVANCNRYQHSGWQPLNDGPQMSAQRQIAVLSPAA